MKRSGSSIKKSMTSGHIGPLLAIKWMVNVLIGAQIDTPDSTRSTVTVGKSRNVSL